jgi:uncharacterized membrane protein YraQ (UPF0718 family)
MLEIIRREAIYFWYYFDLQLRRIVGYWILDMVLGSFISVFGNEKIHSLFAALQGKKLGALGIIPASLIGIASPPVYVRHHPYCRFVCRKRYK